MAIYDLSGSTTGAGIVTPITPTKIAVVGGTTIGSAPVDGTVTRNLIVGGQAYGYGSIEDHLLVLGEGLATGASVAQGTLYRILPVQGKVIGSARLFESAPERIVGRANVNVSYIVDHIPCPIECPAAVPTLRWGQTLGVGDLMLAIRDLAGNPFAPIIVLYRLYQVLPGGGLLPVGDPNRRPAKCGKRLGVYYVTGIAGDCGQPGDWVVEWRWQRSTFAPTQMERRPFKVLDAVLDTSTPDGTCRVNKYGWDD